MRTYVLYVGKLDEAVRHYQEFGWPTLEHGGFDSKLVGYFISDAGGLNKVIHLWKFDDDADRRHHWRRVDQGQGFAEFAARLRPLVLTQENQLLLDAPWGPHP
ncbi:NIPSNAP family protein [Pelagibius sp.]|uniref:NIPSNAP family protein n=1 Tax=Pelagibius sp. TaxID=1931238 RepID=UPI003BB1153E